MMPPRVPAVQLSPDCLLGASYDGLAPRFPHCPLLQRALKIEKRTDVRTVRAEFKTLRRLQAGCRQAVRVFEGGEHPRPGALLRLCRGMGRQASKGWWVHQEGR